MEIFYNHSVVWFTVGILFFILEFALPGFIVFFLGIGAWITGLYCLFFFSSLEIQLALFISGSILSVILFRKSLVKINWGNSNSPLQDEYIGKLCKSLTFISPESPGKVEFKGTTWDARSFEIIQPGEQVEIIKTESIVLIVKPIK